MLACPPGLGLCWGGPARSARWASALGTVDSLADPLPGCGGLREECHGVVARPGRGAAQSLPLACVCLTGACCRHSPGRLALAQKVDAELSKALAVLESEKEAALKGLDAQVEKLSADILGRVLPEGVRV